MREIPILFSTPMVQAILDGRKTMTRRVIKPQPFWVAEPGIPFKTPDANPKGLIKCPYGQPGDRLWVRETCGEVTIPSGELITVYKADNPRYQPKKWQPSIHMPKYEARIWLEVVSVRVERLQEIAEEDAKAEGLACLTKDRGTTYKYGIPDSDGLPGNDDYGWHWTDWNVDPKKAFRHLWDKINLKRGFGWDTNPWGWVISFKKVTP